MKKNERSRNNLLLKQNLTKHELEELVYDAWSIVEDLQKELKTNIKTEMVDKLVDASIRIRDLEKENEELKERINELLEVEKKYNELLYLINSFNSSIEARHKIDMY